MNDKITHADTPNGPSRSPFAITPHNVNELPVIPKAIYIGTGGDIVLRGVNGTSDVTFKNMPSGVILDVMAQYVRAAGTTASDLVGMG